MREKSIFVIAAIGAMVATSGAAFGQSLGSDAFNYSGPLTSNGWAAHSGAGNKVQMANGSFATLEQSGGSGEDLNLKFFGGVRSVTDVTWAGFDVNVQNADLSINPDASGLYFAHMRAEPFTFRARTGLVAPSGGGDWGLAINASSSNLGAGSSWASDLSFDTWYRVVIMYNAATGESKLWLDASVMGDTNVSHIGSSGATINGFALRQSNDYTGMVWIDNVKLGMTFNDVVVRTPGALALFGVGGLLALRRRRH